VKHPVYLLSGQELLVSEALDKVRADSGADPLSEAAFDSAVAPHELLNALETPSLLGGRRLVVVHGAEGLSKDQIGVVTRYLESPSASSVLVLVAGGRTKLDSAVKKAGALITLEVPRGRRLVGWLRERARTHNLKLDDRAGWAMVDTVGTELRDLDGALAQLSSAFGPGARVGVAEVKKMFARLADERIYVFTDAVGDRRLPIAMATLRRLLEQGEEPLVLFGALTAHVRRMLRVRRHADRGPAAVSDAIGLPNWRAERLARQARLYDEAELVGAMRTLAETDVEMKGGDIPPEAALEGAVVRIVTRRG
jgi:DNA polymerase III subunit delta